jgi:hypothetical protein
MKGRTKWFKTRDTYPVRPGWYECGVLLTSMQKRLIVWELKFDGVGFLCPFPMRVPVWRGMTKRAHDEAIAKAKGKA